jgi:hypothetical protein
MLDESLGAKERYPRVNDASGFDRFGQSAIIRSRVLSAAIITTFFAFPCLAALTDQEPDNSE